MNPFLQLLTNIIDLYMLAIIVWVVLGLLIYFKVVNRGHPVVAKVDDFLTRLIEPALRPIRKVLPPISGIDISPVLLLLLLQFIQSALVYYFFRY